MAAEPADPTAPADAAVDPAFDLVAYLVAAARGAPDMGRFTASLFLIQAAGKLAAMQGDGDFYERLAATIDEQSLAALFDSPEAYVAFLDRAVVDVAAEVRSRNGLPAVGG